MACPPKAPSRAPAGGRPGRRGERSEPHVRLVRVLLPRTECVAMFGPAGELQWSSDPTTGPDLLNIVDDALLAAGADPQRPGQLRLLEGNLPVYVCPLRDETQRLLACVAVVGRAQETGDKRPHDFRCAYSLLAPVLECMRRELLMRATIDELNDTCGGFDKDLSLLRICSSSEEGAVATDWASELQTLLQQTIEHLHACTGALLVPERNVMLVRTAGILAPDAKFLMRVHRRLLMQAQAHRRPAIMNETQSAARPDALPYRVLCCPLRSRAGRFIGVLALLRERSAEGYTDRDAQA